MTTDDAIAPQSSPSSTRRKSDEPTAVTTKNATAPLVHPSATRRYPASEIRT